MKNLSGEVVLITSGPTREKIDPIRFISNRSTGKMGSSIALKALELGAKVILIHGPMNQVIPEDIEDIPVESALEMLEKVQENFSRSTISIFCAAVANYRPKEYCNDKFKAGDEVTLSLVRNPDIAKWCGENRKEDQILVGFTAESQDLLNAARHKLENKKLDMIFANQIGVPGIGFESSDNDVTLIDNIGNELNSGKMPKANIAEWILDQVSQRRGVE